MKMLKKLLKEAVKMFRTLVGAWAMIFGIILTIDAFLRPLGARLFHGYSVINWNPPAGEMWWLYFHLSIIIPSLFIAGIKIIPEGE